MSSMKKEIMAQKIKEYESTLYKYFFEINEKANSFFYDMLNDFSVSIWFTILSDLIQYIHIFFYPFKENVSYYHLLNFII